MVDSEMVCRISPKETLYGAPISVLVAGALVVLTLTFAACSPAGTPTPATVSRTLTLAHPTTFPDLDPSTSFSNENVVISNVYEPLIWYNPPGSQEVLRPALAERWESSADGLTWTFYLRRNVKFHDGTPFNAEAVKFSIERTKELNGGAAWIWKAVKAIEAKDEHTVVFQLDYAAPLDLIASSGYAAWMISPAAKNKDSQWFNAGHDAGSGPYMFETYRPGQEAVLARFDDYWGGWQEDQFDKVVIEIIEDPAVRQQKIEADQADWTYELPIENLQKLGESAQVKIVIESAYLNLLGLFNHKKPPLDKLKVRQALSYAFPYDTFLKTVMFGYATQSRGPVPAGMFGHDPALFQYKYDPDKAKSLLAEAGYPKGGFELTMTYATGDNVEEQAGELWQAELAKLGVILDLKPLPWEAQWSLGKSDPASAQDIFVMYWWPTYVTPYDFLFNMFHSEQEPLFNLGYYRNPAFDEQIDQAHKLSGSDKAAAEAMFKTAQKILVDDAAALFFFDQAHIHIIREDIKGYVDNPAYPHVVFVYQLSR